MKRTSLTLLTLAFTLASATGAVAQIARNVVRADVGSIDLVAYKTGVKDVVYLRGSFPAGDDKSPENNSMIATLTGAMLDRGTTKQDKFAIASKLEAVGASINFSVGETVTSFSARCLARDVPLVVSLLAEQLREPAFGEEELGKLKKQLAGNFKRQLESTDFRATDEFNRAVYSHGHPNRHPTVDQILADIEAATIDDLKKFHADHYGPAHLTIVAAGDVDTSALEGNIRESFAGWSGGTAPRDWARTGPTDAPKEQSVFMAGKPSVSIALGQPSHMRYGDPEFFELRTATAILGTGFTGRLMANVRDKEGLTYGIGATMTNDTFTDGEWRITATFAPDLLDKGMESTMRQLNDWHANGVTPVELANRKENLIGSFKVGLATTDGMSQSLLLSIQRGKSPAWLDEYPDVINGLSLEGVNAAIRKHLDPQKMVLVKAGSVPGAAPTK